MMERGAEGFDTDEDLDAWQGELNALLAQAGDKFLACRVVVDKAKFDADFYKAEAARLLSHAERLTAVQDRVKDLALKMLLATGEEKIETADGSWVKVKRTKTESVECEDLTFLPESCLRRSVAPDKVAIKKLLKDGQEVPGAVLAIGESVSIQWGK